MKTRTIKYDLISNAKDSLTHAVEHLTNPDGVNDADLKRAICDVFHVIELLLKEKLRRIHPAFIWQDIDKYTSQDVHTVSVEKALGRLQKVANIYIAKDSIEIIFRCKRIRNCIEHYELQIESKEAKVIIGSMLSVIFSFSKTYLNLNLEKEIRNNKMWSELIQFYEFWDVHSKEIEKQMHDENIPAMVCPSCGANTFNVNSETCAMCDHRDKFVGCNVCGEQVLESDSEESNEPENIDAHGQPDGFVTKTICKNCITKYENMDPGVHDIWD